VAAVALLVFAVTRSRKLTAVPLLAGLVSTMWIGYDLQDPAGPFGGAGPNIHLEWGIWLALGASLALMAASTFLIFEVTRNRGQRAGSAARSRARKSERRARRRFLACAAEFTEVVSVESDGLLFLTSTAEQSDFFVKRTRKELHVLKKALAILESEGCELAQTTLVDAGAFIGTTTLAALRAGFGEVVACEPDPDSARLLRANVALNRAEDSVKVLEVAVADEAGTAPLSLGRSSRSKSTLVRATVEEAVEVTTVRLDDLVRDGVLDTTDIGLLWLDVEGYEGRALAGAEALLERSPPLVMELYPELLRRAGSLSTLPSLLATHYTDVADLRSSEASLQPLAVLPELIERYDQSKTDLLLFGRAGPVDA
jgi:FkbM family methyltransferase